MSSIQLVGIVGSLRKGSYNRMLIEAIKALAPQHVTITLAEIGDLPLFNADFEKESYPEAAKRFKEAVRAANGIIIAMPEYNRSIPGVLKNAIDWASRPYGDSVWEQMPILVVGASTGAIGTAVGQYHLKQVLLYLNARLVGQPEFHLGGAKDKFNEQGQLIDEKTKEFIVKALEALIQEIGNI